MPSKLIEHRLRIRNAADSADVLEVTSVRGGTNPYLAGEPTGDGATLDPLSGKVTSGSISGRIVDPITSGTSRLFTSQLEDANFRQQLGQRKSYWEFRVDGGAWQTLYAGRLSRHALASDIEWDVTVSDWMKAEHEYTVFDALPSETIAAYLTRWPNRGAIIGGPILGGFREVKDLGGWEFKVAESGTGVFGTGGGSGSWVRLEFVRGFYPNGNPTTELTDVLRDRVNNAAEPSIANSQFVDSPTHGRIEYPMASFPDLVVLVNDDRANPRTALSRGTPGDYALLRRDATPGSLFLHGTLASLGLTLNTIVKIVVITRKVTPASPIYWTGHPIDFVTTLLGEAGIPFTSSSVTTVRNTIGTGARITLEITKAWNLGTIIEEAVYGPFGVGARGAEALADAGKIEFFCSRIFANTPPATTITDADVVEGETQAFNLDTQGAIKRVVFAHTRLTYGKTAGSFEEIFIKQDERFERDNGDPGAIGTGEQSYHVPGMVHFLDNKEIDLRRWVDGRAHEIFDRRGRGALGLETVLLRGGAGDAVKLGDEILVNVKQLPNKNKRLGDDPSVGARAMQVVHLTPTLRGKQVTLEDSGPNAQPIADANRPTHTIAASTVNPRNVALVTITNAATLTAAGYAVRVQVAITTGAAPATTDYSDVLYYSAADIPTTAVGLPPVTAGRTVYVRARTEKAASRPSNWSAGVGVTLTAINAPTALSTVSVAGNGSLLDLTWTIGANASECFTDIYVRASGAAFSTAVKRTTLLPGSNRFRMEGLTPNTAYTVSVQHVDVSTGDTSALTEDTETTANALTVLAAPTSPTGFASHVGTRRPSGFLLGNPFLTEQYGIAVMATEYPSFVEVYQAVETAVGSGAYGTSASIGVVAAASGDWTIWTGMAPNDGLRRQIKARHIREGYTASAFTSIVTVTPWVTSALPPHFAVDSVGILITTALDFSRAYTGKNASNLPRTAANSTPVSTVVQRLADTGHGASDLQDSTGREIRRAFAKALSSDPDTLDSAPDGSTYKKVTGVVSALITPASSTSRNRCKLSAAANQSITTATATKVTWDVEQYDTGGLHDNVTNNTRITIPSGGNTGLWLFIARAAFAANATGIRIVRILKNAGTIVATVSMDGQGAGTSLVLVCVSVEDAPAVGDYFEVEVYQSSGGNLNLIQDNVNYAESSFQAVHLW